MKKSLVFVLILLILCIGCNPHVELLVDDSRLQDGDIAFRGGTSIESNVVEIADKNGIYSHSGMLVKYEGKWKIVHAVPGEENETGGIQYLKMDDLDLFFAPDRACAGCFARYDTTPEVLEKVAQEAIRWWKKKILFDNEYLMSDTTMLYCSQLVQLSFESQGIDVAQGRCHTFPLAKEKVIFPSDILENPKISRYYILEEKPKN